MIDGAADLQAAELFALEARAASRPALLMRVMRSAIARVAHDASGPAVSMNRHGQNELIAALKIDVAGPWPRLRCEVNRDARRCYLSERDARVPGQFFKQAAVAGWNSGKPGCRWLHG